MIMQVAGLRIFSNLKKVRADSNRYKKQVPELGALSIIH